MAATGYTRYQNVQSPTPGLVLIAGTFQANGTSAPDLMVGSGFTVAHTATGKFTVTLSKAYHKIIAVIVTVGETTSTQLFKANTEERDLTTTSSSFIVHTQSTVTDTDTDDQQVNFLCIAADTSIANSRTS